MWIGTGATLLKGSEIPEWCIIGAKNSCFKKIFMFQIQLLLEIQQERLNQILNGEWRE